MTWQIGLRIWFLVAIAALAIAYTLCGRTTSRLPRIWQTINVTLIALVGIAGVIGLNAAADVVAGVVLVAVIAVESVGLWLGVSRSALGRRILVGGGTLCVLLGGIRVLSEAIRAATSTEAASLMELLGNAALNPLLIFLGSVALGIGSRTSGFGSGAYAALSCASFFVAVPLLAIAVNEAVLGEFGWRILALASLALAFCVPVLLIIFRGPMVTSNA